VYFFSKRKKGDKSLEMIIGLMILLVVAAVVIKLFLNYVNPEKVPSTPDQELAVRSFVSDCEALCIKAQNGKSLEYCTTYFEGNDWNNNGIPNEIVSVGAKVMWDVCEDRVYCFHVYDCSWATGKIGMEECRNLLCEAGREKYGDDESASDYVMGLIQEGSCNTASLDPKERWIYSKFADLDGDGSLSGSAYCENSFDPNDHDIGIPAPPGS